MSWKKLREAAQLQAQAIKIATDHGWRGNIAVTAGALPRKLRSGYLERIDAVLSPVRKALGETVFSELTRQMQEMSNPRPTEPRSAEGATAI